MSGYITTTQFSSILRQMKKELSEPNGSESKNLANFVKNTQKPSSPPKRLNPFSRMASKGNLNNKTTASNEKTTQIAPSHAQTKEIPVIVKIEPETSPVEQKTQLPSPPSK